MINILVIDEDKSTQETIKALLIYQGNVSEVYATTQALSSYSIYQRYKPDLIFLNSQMLNHPATEALLAMQKRSELIITMNSAEHVFCLVKSYAIGYLAKPIQAQQFYLVLKQANLKISQRQQSYQDNYDQIRKSITEEPNNSYISRLVIKEQGRIRLIAIDQINYIVGAGNYAELHLFNDKLVLYREKLSALQSQLDPELFLRIHRSTIVRRSSVSELHPNKNGDYRIILKNQAQLILSRKHKKELAQLVSH